MRIKRILQKYYCSVLNTLLRIEPYRLYLLHVCALIKNLFDECAFQHTIMRSSNRATALYLKQK